MINDYYREEILEHYKNPRNFGELAKPDKKIEESNPLCGDTIRMTIRLSDKGKEDIITDVKFTGEGCVLSTAAASVVTDYLKGRSLSEVKKIKKEKILELLGGIEVNPARLKCVLLPLEALRKI